jgi:hypothetical protein
MGETGWGELLAIFSSFRNSIVVFPNLLSKLSLPRPSPANRREK